MSPQPPEPSETDPLLLSAPDIERAVIGALVYDGVAFERANLKSSVFKTLRYRWVWQAAEAISAANDYIDYWSLKNELVKAGRWEDVTALHKDLNYYLDADALPHVEANARLLRDMDRRSRMLADANELARKAFDLNIPLPPDPEAVKSHWTLEELAAAEFPEPEGPVPGLFPNGLIILAGRPKRGKSWMMLQLGCALGLGGRFLERDLQPARVLYYALEDPPRRLKERTAKLGIPAHASIEFELSVLPLQLGGLAALEQAARSGEYQMIVIDTIRRAMPGMDFNREGALFDDVLSQLQVLAQQNHIAIVCVLHTRKSSAGFDPDPIDDVLGSTGMTASADCVLALYTDPASKATTLKGRGRDLDDIDLTIHFDPLTCAWQLCGDTGLVKLSEEEDEILLALGDLGKAKVSSIARAIHKDRSNTSKRCASLWMKGRIRKEEIQGVAHYYLPTHTTPDPELAPPEQAEQISIFPEN